MAFDFENYKGPFVAVPEPIIRNLLDAFSEVENIQILKKCVSYEPDNHHNAALCPYCARKLDREIKILRNSSLGNIIGYIVEDAGKDYLFETEKEAQDFLDRARGK